MAKLATTDNVHAKAATQAKEATIIGIISLGVLPFPWVGVLSVPLGCMAIWKSYKAERLDSTVRYKTPRLLGIVSILLAVVIEFVFLLSVFVWVKSR
jgi:hypothetical protein